MSNKLKIARMVANNNNNHYDRLIAQVETDTSGKWINIDNAEHLIDAAVQQAVSVLMLHGYDDAADCLAQHFKETI